MANDKSRREEFAQDKARAAWETAWYDALACGFSEEQADKIAKERSIKIYEHALKYFRS